MKTIRKTLRSAVVLSMGLGLSSLGYAANSGSKANNNSGQSSSQTSSTNSSTTSNRSGISPLQNYTKGQRLGDVLGREVRTTSGNEVGNVKDLVIDQGSGQIRYVLVSSGGVLGVADTVRAVPPGAISPDNNNGACKVSIDDTKWRNAPTIADNQLSALQQDQRGSEIYHYYGQQWKSDSSSSNSRGLAYATEVKGKDVNANNQKVGEIDDLMVNLQKQKVSAVFDPDNSFSGNDSKYVISFDKLNAPSTSNGSFSTSLSQSDFRNATAMTEDLWLVPTYVAIYTWEVPASSASGGYASASSKDNINNNTSGNNNGSTQNAPVDAVRSAIKTDTQDQGQAIAVSTQNGQVVLQGKVASEEAKNRIERNAEKAANGHSIDNQIQVTGAE